MLLGALISPWIYKMVVALPSWGLGSLPNLIASLQAMPFHRYFSRSVEVIAFLLLWPATRWIGLYHLHELELSENEHALADLLFGAAAALVPLFLLQALLLWQGYYCLSGSISFFFFLKFSSTAALVATLEEFFFRGVLLGVSRHFLRNSRANCWRSLLWTSLFFASIHFLNMPSLPIKPVCWWSGLQLCARAFEGLPAFPLFLGAFLNLTLIGVILAWATIRTASLALPIGLHGAWILGQQCFNHLTSSLISPPEALLPWIGKSQVSGMVPVGLLFLLPLLLTFILVNFWCTYRQRIPRRCLEKL